MKWNAISISLLEDHSCITEAFSALVYSLFMRLILDLFKNTFSSYSVELSVKFCMKKEMEWFSSAHSSSFGLLS
jgi:hypothetical protein